MLSRLLRVFTVCPQAMKKPSLLKMTANCKLCHCWTLCCRLLSVLRSKVTPDRELISLSPLPQPEGCFIRKHDPPPSPMNRDNSYDRLPDSWTFSMPYCTTLKKLEAVGSSHLFPSGLNISIVMLLVGIQNFHNKAYKYVYIDYIKHTHISIEAKSMPEI